MPPGFTDLRLDPDHHLVLHQIGQAAPNWTVENVNRAAAGLRSQESPHRGDHRGFRRSGGQAHGLAGAQRQDGADQDRRCSRKRPRAGGISGPRRALRIQPWRSPDRFRRYSRRPTIGSRSRWSEPIRKKVLFVDDGRRGNAPAVFTGRRSMPRRTRRFRWNTMQPEQAAGIAAVALRVHRAVRSWFAAAGLRRIAAAICDRRRFGAVRPGTGVGRHGQSSGDRRADPGIHATRAAKASVFLRLAISTPAIRRCTAWSGSRE